MIWANEGTLKILINCRDVLDKVLDVAFLHAICQFDVPMEHVTDILPCRQPTQCSLQCVLDNYHIVALLLRCSRHSPMVLQDELRGTVGRPLHLLLRRDHINVDWHTQ